MKVERNLAAATLAAILLTVILLLVFLGENNRMAAESRSQQGGAIARGALSYDAYCSGCHGERGGGRAGLAPPLNVDDLWGNRKGLAFYSSMHDYVYLTISSGHFTQDMPAWATSAGGPLRDDQIEDVAQFIMNWTGPQPSEVRTPAPDTAHGDAGRGEDLFDRNCAECHGPKGRGTTDGPTLVSGEAAARGDAFFRKTISGGIPGTPMVPWAWEEELGAQDIEDLIVHIRSLQ